jgi:hypothetical protein
MFQKKKGICASHDLAVSVPVRRAGETGHDYFADNYIYYCSSSADERQARHLLPPFRIRLKIGKEENEILID